MTDPHIADVFRELKTRGLIAAAPAPVSLPQGNVDRKDPTRSSWRVPLEAGGEGKLTLGRDLTSLAVRHANLARACPAIVTAQLSHVRLPASDALLESYFAGSTLASVLTHRSLPPATIRQAVNRICAALAATEQPSSEPARAAEWNSWVARLVALSVWRPAEARDLEQSILPALYQRLAAGAPVTRWTNGDFLPGNILLDARGESRLIDAEFATRTHFFAEDAVRFHALSSLTGPQLADLTLILPDPGPAWHLYFWLRQLQLEVDHNNAAYVDRVREARLGVISRLAEVVLQLSLPDWSVAASEVHYRVEDAHWSQAADFALRLTGWCHVPGAGALRSIVVTLPSGRQVAGCPLTARPDVRQHFAGDERAADSGFALSVQLEPDEASVILSALTEDNLLLPFHVFRADDLPGRTDFSTWAARHDPDPPPPPTPANGPLFSILLPVYNTPLPFLTACIESVFRQHHPHWELCIVDDASSSPAVVQYLGALTDTKQRVRLQTRAVNGGISRATNDALAAATGEFIILLDHDDALRPHALTEFARHLAAEPSLDAVYSDEDKITADGRRFLHSFKPDFSPEYLLGVMYVGHALCVRTQVARATGGFDPAFDGIQDYEFFLRVTERTRRIGHIPKILYHWRQSPASSALTGNIKGDMDERQVAAVRGHLQRRGRTEEVAALGGHRVRLTPVGSPPSATVLAPANLQLPTGWNALSLTGHDPLEWMRQAISLSQTEVVLLVSAPPLGAAAGWQRELAAVASLPDSGMVAPLLLSRGGQVLESGWTVGPEGTAPLMRGFPADHDGYNGTLRCNREVAAVSPLCVAIRRERLLEALAKLPPEAGWLNLCHRLHSGGCFNRVCAAAWIRVDPPAGNDAEAWAARPRLAGDAFFNPNFDPKRADHRLRRPVSAPRWHLDVPIESPNDGYIHWRGWCWAGAENPVVGIRFSTPTLILTGTIGLSRPDVRSALPETDDSTGFEIRGILPSGRYSGSLEAGLADGSWHRLASHPLQVVYPVLPRWIDGGDLARRIAFQAPTQPLGPARPVQPEKFGVPANPHRRRPRISIVTPSYQQVRFLGETMRSVLELQDGVDGEYVVQDGGSDDGSRTLIERLAAAHHEPGASTGERKPAPPRAPRRTPQLLAWSSERDAGQAEAIARAFAKTSGTPEDLMAWINSDDFYLPGALAWVADYFAQHPGVDVIYGHRIVVNEESQEIARWFLPRHDPAVLRLYDFVPQETMFWRRRIWDQVGGIGLSFKFALDWDLLLRFQSAGARIVRVPRFFACFRVHAVQKTSAAMATVGQGEINLLRERTHGRPFPAQELEQNPLLLGYLRRSAFIEFLWRRGIRAP